MFAVSVFFINQLVFQVALTDFIQPLKKPAHYVVPHVTDVQDHLQTVCHAFQAMISIQQQRLVK